MDFAIIFLIGICIGSFLNVVIDRIPHGKSILWGRSCCDYCKKTLGVWDLFPLFSFLFLHGRCRYCHKRLSLQYPLVECATGVIFVALFIFLQPLRHTHGLVSLLVNWALFATLLAIFVTDFKYRIIPDEEVLFLIGIATIITVTINSGWSSVGHHVFVGFFYALFFLVLYVITRGKGMGLGDVKLAFAIGLLLGFPKIIIAFYLSFLTGALISTILIFKGTKRLKSKIAFGPFLIVGTVISYVYGDVLWRFFQKLIGV